MSGLGIKTIKEDLETVDKLYAYWHRPVGLIVALSLLLSTSSFILKLLNPIVIEALLDFGISKKIWTVTMLGFLFLECGALLFLWVRNRRIPKFKNNEIGILISFSSD